MLDQFRIFLGRNFSNTCLDRVLSILQSCQKYSRRATGQDGHWKEEWHARAKCPRMTSSTGVRPLIGGDARASRSFRLIRSSGLVSACRTSNRVAQFESRLRADVTTRGCAINYVTTDLSNRHYDYMTQAVSRYNACHAAYHGIFHALGKRQHCK